MPFTVSLRSLAFALMCATASAAAQAQPLRDGFLCCNMRSDGSWISDINYLAGKQLIPAGTPVKITGYGRQRVLVEIGGKPLAIGNDYSRSLTLEAFAQRYVVDADPVRRVETFPPRVREAIQAGRVMRGMTREQVLMAIGYPITSYTAQLDAHLWRYWISRSGEYQVFWSDDGRVEKVFGPPDVRAQVTLE
jgi:hypothetical protein